MRAAQAIVGALLIAVLGLVVGGCAAGSGEAGDSASCGGRACRDGGGGASGGSPGARPDAWAGTGGGWTIPDGPDGDNGPPDGGSGGSAGWPDARPWAPSDASPGGGGGGDAGGASSACGSETYLGRCDGNTVVWCEGAAIQRDPCASGYTCGFSAQLGYYACVPTGGGGSCGSVSFVGHCLGTTTVEWCENGALHTFDCASGYACGYNGDAGYYACIP